jgi:hypothetical protein
MPVTRPQYLRPQHGRPVPRWSCVALSSRICFAAICATTLTGCGDNSGPQRIEVSGNLSWGDGIEAGEPVADGLISFLPAGELNGPAANVDIEDGYYHFDDVTGPVAGLHRVVVSVEAMPHSEDAPIDPANKSGGLRRWEFQFEVPTTGPVTHDLTLDDV